MTLPENCKTCEHHKFRVVSMVLDAKDAGIQCHHPYFKQEEGSIVKDFKVVKDKLNIPNWCPLKENS